MARLERVLAATEGGEYGKSAVVTGAALAERAGAVFEVATVVEVLLLPTSYAGAGVEATEYEGTFIKEARARAEEQVREAGAAGATIHVRSGFAAPLVNKIAEEARSDLIVVGAHPQPALARFLVGSTAERIIRLANRPLLVATEPRREPFRRILAAIDLSEQSRRVLRAAGAIAAAEGAELRIVHVQEPLQPMLVEAEAFNEEEYRRRIPEQLARATEESDLPEGLRMETRTREGHAGHELLEEAKDSDADLIVMGTHGFGFFERLLLGSTSLHVLRHGERAAVIVPPVEAE